LEVGCLRPLAGKVAGLQEL